MLTDLQKMQYYLKDFRRPRMQQPVPNIFDKYLTDYITGLLHTLEPNNSIFS